jgi:predicted phosphodiesterase
MELQMKTKFSLLVIIALIITSCIKDQDFAGMFYLSDSVNKRFDQSMKWNSKHPYNQVVVPSYDYSILAMADSHVGGTNNLDSFLVIAKTKKAAAVIMSGDLTTGHAKDYIVFEQQLPAQDTLPIFLEPGNHDLEFGGWNEFFTRFGSSCYLFTIKTLTASDLFICLDTGGGTLGEKQLDWLTDVLQTMRSNYRNCIVVTHNNLFRFRLAETTNPPIEELQTLIGLFTKHHVDMVITGHDHKQDAIKFGVTTYIVMDPLKDGESNAGYFQVIVKNGNISYKFERL